MEKVFMFFLTKSTACNEIIQQGLGEAYDLGYRNGLHEGAALTKGKKYANKVKKALKNAYKVKS